MAIAFPMPRLAPVTMATLSCNVMGFAVRWFFTLLPGIVNVLPEECK
jgi:hypothetical protein